MDIEITEPQTDAEYEQYYRLRWERLRQPHGDAYGSERDSPLEATSEHLIAKVDGRDRRRHVLGGADRATRPTAAARG